MALLRDALGREAAPGGEGRIPVQTASPGEASAAIARLVAEGVAVTDFAMGAPSLEEVFFALTGRPPEEDTR